MSRGNSTMALMGLMPDDKIISVHSPKKAFWERGLCTVRGSITPKKFVQDLLINGLVEGWTLGRSSNTISHCRVPAGIFKAAHLWDMSDAWLRKHQAEIAIATGVLPYWTKRELLIVAFYAPKEDLLDFNGLTPDATTRLKHFLETLWQER